MKKAFLLLCTLLLVLGCALPLAAYHLTRAVLGPAVSTVRLPLSSPESTASAPEISAAYAGDADRFLIQDTSTGQVLELSRQEYLIGQLAGRSTQGTGRCRPQLRAVLPRPCRTGQYRLADGRPGTTAGLPD